jgi:heme/copper-type cytochrome/quinol oxidase subunit 2
MFFTYLLPIFIGIIGGLIMYFALRNRDAKMAKKRLLLSILLLIAEIAISMAIAIFWIES